MGAHHQTRRKHELHLESIESRFVCRPENFFAISVFDEIFSAFFSSLTSAAHNRNHATSTVVESLPKTATHCQLKTTNIPEDEISLNGRVGKVRRRGSSSCRYQGYVVPTSSQISAVPCISCFSSQETRSDLMCFSSSIGGFIL